MVVVGPQVESESSALVMLHVSSDAMQNLGGAAAAPKGRHKVSHVTNDTYAGNCRFPAHVHASVC